MITFDKHNPEDAIRVLKERTCPGIVQAVLWTPEEHDIQNTGTMLLTCVDIFKRSSRQSLEDLELPIKPSDAMVILSQILKGLQYLYFFGFSHGQIDLHNVLLCPRKVQNHEGLAADDYDFKLTGFNIPKRGAVVTQSDVSRDMAGVRKVLAKLVFGYHLNDKHQIAEPSLQELVERAQWTRSYGGLYHRSHSSTTKVSTTWTFSTEFKKLLGKLGDYKQCFCPAAALEAIDEYVDNLYRFKLIGEGFEGAVFSASVPGNVAAAVAVKTSRFVMPCGAASVCRASELRKRIGVHPNVARNRIFVTAYNSAAMNPMDYNESPQSDFADTFYMNEVMKLALGDLYHIILPLHPREALEVVRQILCGLVHLHSKDVVHGDIKPGNILVYPKYPNDSVPAGSAASKYSFQITDLGMASRPRDIDPDSIYGTPGYMAPEISSGSRLQEQDMFKRDIYALGISLKELCQPCLIKSGELYAYPGIYLKRDEAICTKTTMDPEIQELIEALTCQCYSSRPSAADALRRVENLLQPHVSQVVGPRPLPTEPRRSRRFRTSLKAPPGLCPKGPRPMAGKSQRRY